MRANPKAETLPDLPARRPPREPLIKIPESEIELPDKDSYNPERDHEIEKQPPAKRRMPPKAPPGQPERYAQAFPLFP